MTPRLTFGKKERLKSNLAIQKLLQDGNTVFVFPLKIYWNLSPYPQQKFPVRAAVIVPKRKFRKAVDRNLMKRRLREAYRNNKHILYHALDKQEQKIDMIILLLSDEFIPYNRLDQGTGEILRKLVNKLS